MRQGCDFVYREASCECRHLANNIINLLRSSSRDYDNRKVTSHGGFSRLGGPRAPAEHTCRLSRLDGIFMPPDNSRQISICRRSLAMRKISVRQTRELWQKGRLITHPHNKTQFATVTYIAEPVLGVDACHRLDIVQYTSTLKASASARSPGHNRVTCHSRHLACLTCIKPWGAVCTEQLHAQWHTACIPFRSSRAGASLRESGSFLGW